MSGVFLHIRFSLASKLQQTFQVPQTARIISDLHLLHVQVTLDFFCPESWLVMDAE